MKPVTLLIASTVLATSASVIIVHELLPPKPALAPTDEPATSNQSVELGERLARLEQEIQSVRDQLARPERQAAPEIDDALIRGAIAKWLERTKDTELGKRVANAAATKPSPDFETAVKRLRTEDLSWEQRSALWASLSEPEQRRLVARFEEIAKANPFNADTQVELANAYLNMSQVATDAAEKGELATKADKVFDKALEIDDHHWQARFTKAVSLTFWPDFLGRKPEAIKNFEILMQQQESAPARDEHAQTYLYLGNLYAQQGKDADAKKVWARGLKRFPTNKLLQDKLAR